MSAQDCINSIQGAVEGGLSGQELEEVLETLQQRQRLIQARDRSLSLEEAAMKAADELKANAEMAKKIEKRNAYINYRRKWEAIQYVRDNWKDNYRLGIESLLVGTSFTGRSSKLSIGAQQKALSQSYIGGLLNDMHKDGVLPLLTSGAVDRDVSRALWQLNKTEPNLKGIDGNAVTIAKNIRKWQEAARIDANRAGAAIGQRDDYITRQSHDPHKMWRHGEEEWKRFMRNNLDPVTFQNVPDVDRFLSEAFEGLTTGVHLKATTGKGGFKGPANLAKKISQERVLHFKDADAWHEYNQVFGTGSIRESVIGSLDHLGESTALMRRLGTNPGNTLSQVYDALIRDLSGKAKKDFQEYTAEGGKASNYFKELDGTTRIPVKGSLARFGANLRAIENMAKLGGATLSAISDLPIAAMELRYQGENLLSSMGNLLKGLVEGRKSDEQKEILSQLGIFFDGMRGDVISRFSLDDSLGGKLSRAQHLFFKLNGLQWWTDSMRSSVALMTAHGLARKSSVPYEALGDLSRTLELYGIDSAKWDLLRLSPQKAANGKTFITTESIDNIPSEAIGSYLESQGLKVSDAAVSEVRDDLKSRLTTYITDRTSHGVLEPDVKTRAIWRRGTQPGTVQGELLRFVSQFKSFTTAVIQKTYGRELYGRGMMPTEHGTAFSPIKNLGKAIANGQGEMLAMAQLMTLTTLFGYAAMSAKDMAKGRTPRDPNDGATWMAAMLQGGALGIYGDYLFGEVNRFGGSFTQTMAGPAIGLGEELLGLWNRGRLTLSGEDGDLMAASFRTALSHTPFINLFYTRTAMDYLFLYNVQEWLNPGSIRRMQRRIEKDNNQEFLIRPTEAIR